MLAALAAWEMVGSDGTAAQCAELALAALEGGRLLAADPALMPFAAIVTLVVADRPEAVEIFRGMVADAHRHGSLLSAGSALLWCGYGELRRGDLAAAEESAAGRRDAARALGPRRPRGSAQPHCFRPRSCTSAAAPRKRSRCSSGSAPTIRRRNTTGWWLATRATVLTAAGRAEEAVDGGGRARRPLRGRCPTPARLWWRSLKAEALDRSRCDEASRWRARSSRSRARSARRRRSAGRCACSARSADDGSSPCARPSTVLEASTARLEHAKALAALGSALRRARRPTEAREPLRRALELAGVCGADGARRARPRGAARRRAPAPAATRSAASSR